MSKKSAPVISNVSVTPASGPGGTIFSASVTASGFPSLRITYQWRLDGVAIAGATGSSLIASAAGALTVLVTATNNQGTDTRESAPVTVSPALAPPAVTQARIAPETGAVEDVFTAVAEATGVPVPSLSYQWALDGIAIGGATEASYIASTAGRLSLRVTARNVEGADSVETAPVVVDATASIPAIIALRVEPRSGRVGDAFTATVEATGSPAPTIACQWLLDGIVIPGATGNVHAANADGTLSVRITATNAAGSVSAESDAVPVEPALVMPSIVAATISPTAGRAGDRFGVSVSATGNPTPSLGYQWMIEGLEIGGATGSTFVPALEGRLSVRVTASNPAGSDTLETAPIVVAAPLSPPMISTITIAPSSGRAGDAFTGVAEVMGEPAPEVRFQWVFDGVAVEGAIGPSFVPAAVGPLSLRVTATNAQGSDVRESETVLLEPALVAPLLTSLAITPDAGSVGDRFSVTAAAAGDPAPALDYQWKLDGEEIPGATDPEFVASGEGTLTVRVTARNLGGADSRETGGAIVGAALSAPAILGLAVSPGAGRVRDTFAATVEVAGNPAPLLTYQWLLDGAAIEGATEQAIVPEVAGALSVLVTATNAEGADSALSASVLVEPALAAPRVKSADILPSIGRVGDTFTIASTAVGNPTPELRYVWVHEDQVIEGATGISYTATEVGTLFVRVIATNSEGEDIRESGAVEVEPALVAPSITDATVQPSSGSVGDNFRVSVAATGNPAPMLAFQWLMDRVEVAGATAGTFVPAAEGSLSVRVTATNSEGSDSRETATVPVAAALTAPRITEARIEPSAGRVGDNYTAFVASTGNPEPLVSYQWMLDGSPIAGATSLSFTADIVGVLGLRVTARNSEGEFTAEAAPVTVEAALASPVLTTATIAPASGQVGTTFTASATASGNPTPIFSYQWQLSGAAIAGATTPNYSATAPGTLTVRVTASNSLGTDSVESGAATITSDPSPTVFETGIFEEGVFA